MLEPVRLLAAASLCTLSLAAGLSLLEARQSARPPSQTVQAAWANIPTVEYKRDLAALIEGRVVDGLGRPIADSQVTVSDWGAPGSSLNALVVSTPEATQRTSTDGSFRFEGLPYGMKRIEAATPDGFLIRIEHSAYYDGAGAAGLELVLGEHTHAQAQVVDEAGRPLTGAALAFEGDPDSVRLYTSADGLVEIPVDWYETELRPRPIRIVNRSSALVEPKRTGPARFEIVAPAGGALGLMGTQPEETERTAPKRHIKVPLDSSESGPAAPVGWRWTPTPASPLTLAERYPLRMGALQPHGELSGAVPRTASSLSITVEDTPGMLDILEPGAAPRRVPETGSASLQGSAESHQVSVRTAAPFVPFVIEDSSGVHLRGFTDAFGEALVPLNPGFATGQSWADRGGRASPLVMLNVDGKEDQFRFDRTPGLDVGERAIFGLLRGNLHDDPKDVQISVQSSTRLQGGLQNEDGAFWLAGVNPGWARVTAFRSDTGEIISEVGLVEIPTNRRAVEVALELLPNYLLLERRQIGFVGTLELRMPDGELYKTLDLSKGGHGPTLLLTHVPSVEFTVQFPGSPPPSDLNGRRVSSLPLPAAPSEPLTVTHIE